MSDFEMCATCPEPAELAHDHCLAAECVLACDECGPEAAEDMRAQDALDERRGK